MASAPARVAALLLCVATAGACNAILGIEAGAGLLEDEPAGGAGAAGGTGGGGGGPGGSGSCALRGQAPQLDFAWGARVGPEAEVQSPYRDGAVAVRGDGEVFTAGTFTGMDQLGVAEQIDTGDDAGDLVVVERDGDSGEPVRVLRFGGSGLAVPTDLAVDRQSGSFAVAGRFTGTLSFGDAWVLESAGSRTDPDLIDLFVAVIAADGTVKWAKRLGDARSQDTARVAFDPTGNLVVAALGRGAIDWGGELRDAGDEIAVFLAKLDGAGDEIWSRLPLLTQRESTDEIDVAVGSDGAVFVVGSTYDNAEFGGTAAGETLFGDDHDAYVAKYDADGAWKGHRYFGDVGQQGIRSAVVGPDGALIVAGRFEGGLRQNGAAPALLLDNAEPPSGDGSSANAFVARLRGDDLAVEWTAQVSGAGEQFFTGVAVDCAGNVTVIGDAVDALGARDPGVDFGDGELVAGLPDDTTNGYYDVLLASYGGDGALLRGKRVVDPVHEYSHGVAVDDQGNAVFTGYFSQSVVFSSEPNGQLSTTGGEWDQFTVRWRFRPQ